jgi:ABC-type amino acid transport substrate-binding protein
MQTSSHAKAVELGYFHIPPYSYHNEVGPPTGIMADILIRSLERNDIPYHFNNFPSKRYFYCVTKGIECQVQFTVKGLPQFDDVLFISDDVAITVELKVYSKLTTQKFNTLEDFTGKTVVLLRGYHYNGIRKHIEQLSPSVAIINARDTETAIKLVQIGRGDYLLQYGHLVSHSDSADVVNLVSRSLITTNYHLSTHRSIPNAQNLLKQLNKTVMEMKTSGEIDAITQRYLMQNTLSDDQH